MSNIADDTRLSSAAHAVPIFKRIMDGMRMSVVVMTLVDGSNTRGECHGIALILSLDHSLK